MKIWQIIENGKDGEVYKCKNSSTPWDNATIEVKEESKGTKYEYKAIILQNLASPAHSNDTRIGATVPLCGAVIRADWEKVIDVKYVSVGEAMQAYLEGKTIASYTEKDSDHVYATYKKGESSYDTIDIDEIETMYWAIHE